LKRKEIRNTITNNQGGVRGGGGGGRRNNAKTEGTNLREGKRPVKGQTKGMFLNTINFENKNIGHASRLGRPEGNG